MAVPTGAAGAAEVASGRGVLVALAPAMAVGWGAEVAAGADVALGGAVAAGPDGGGVAVADEPQATAITNNIAATTGKRIPELNSRCLDISLPPYPSGCNPQRTPFIQLVDLGVIPDKDGFTFGEIEL